METIRTHLLDTSALVKLVVDEDGSDRIRKYFAAKSVCWTTSLCFAEALGVLKVKHFYRKEISREKYLSASEELVANLRNESISVEEVNITEISIFNEVEKISKSYAIDLADAFQIITIKKGFPSSLEGDSRTILITGDSDLAKAAINEGLRVWDCMNEENP
jgi:predicted nucleic acid-binding protein